MFSLIGPLVPVPLLVVIAKLEGVGNREKLNVPSPPALFLITTKVPGKIVLVNVHVVVWPYVTVIAEGLPRSHEALVWVQPEGTTSEIL